MLKRIFPKSDYGASTLENRFRPIHLTLGISKKLNTALQQRHAKEGVHLRHCAIKIIFTIHGNQRLKN